MNRYASLALTYWETHRAEELARIEDREMFFAQLGEQISYQVAELTREMRRGGSPDEGYLAKAERFRRDRERAEDQILREIFTFSGGQHPGLPAA